MAQVTRQSPYTVPGDGPDGVDPNLLAGIVEYAVPDPVQSATQYGAYAHGDNGGSATPLRESTTGTPDASRLRHAPLFETRPGEGEPVAWWRRFTRDVLGRHSVEYQDADGQEVAPRTPAKVPDKPRPSDVGEPRPTQRMNPNTYLFTRPMPGLGVSGHLNGAHFSMADHRRDYSILGMTAPRKVKRNTFRLEPEPWDSDLVDKAPVTDPSPNVQVVGQIIPSDGVLGGTRSWRL